MCYVHLLSKIRVVTVLYHCSLSQDDILRNTVSGTAFSTKPDFVSARFIPFKRNCIPARLKHVMDSRTENGGRQFHVNLNHEYRLCWRLHCQDVGLTNFQTMTEVRFCYIVHSTFVWRVCNLNSSIPVLYMAGETQQ